jgi:hypothetical protein
MLTGTDISLAEWLMQQGGPVVRYRTAVELLDMPSGSEVDRLSDDLLHFRLVQTWLERLNIGDLLKNDLEQNQLTESTLWKLAWVVHSSKNTALENVLGKLLELGLRAGLVEFDRRMQPFDQFFSLKIESGKGVLQSAWFSLGSSIFAGGLLRAGYQPSDALCAYLNNHLRAIHRIAGDRVYDIFASESELVGLPKAWIGKPIIKPEIMERYHLPWIHDMNLLAFYPMDLRTVEAQTMIDDIVAYILDPRFQSLHNGYGYAWIKEKHTCYGWGWSPHLPGFFGFGAEKGIYASTQVQRVELMAHFRAAWQSPWFKLALEHLEQFRTDQGSYRFPAEYLREQPDGGYYVTGAYMGLGENRRNRQWIEIESTFRMLKIKRLISE